MEKMTEKDIVVMIDMQDDFITGALGSPAAQAIVPKVVEFLRKLPDDVCVIATKDSHPAAEEYATTLEGKMLPVPHCRYGTDGWELQRDITEWVYERSKKGNCKITTKNTFGSRALPIYVSARVAEVPYVVNEMTIHCLGLCTDICVIVNMLLLRTHFPNTRIICHADMCAGTSPEAHKAALTVMKSCQIEIVGE